MCFEVASFLGRDVPKVVRRLGIKIADDSEFLLVYGGDREILEALRESDKIVVGISPRGVNAALAFAPEDFFPLLYSKAECLVTEIPKLSARIGGGMLKAVNEIAIFPRRPATIMAYTLRIDGELAFGDAADGVLIATPLGSTAYARSAGGPIIDLRARVVEVVPVNSLGNRRPYVLPTEARVEIADIRSRHSVEAIADGKERRRLTEASIIVTAGSKAKLLRPLLKHKAIEPQKLPPSARFVYKILSERGPMTASAIAESTNLPRRTVAHALRTLRMLGLVEARSAGGIKLYFIK